MGNSYFRPAASGARPGARAPVWPAILLFALACAIRLAFAAELPVRTDEIYTVLPARSWAAEGTLRLWRGEYDRAALYTMLVGSLFDLTGQATLFVARMLSVVAGSALVAAVFLWVRREADAVAGWAAALLLAGSALAVNVDQYARFYALLGLLVWLGSTAVYRVVTDPGARFRPLMLGGALLAFVLALQLQIITLVALGGLAVFVAIVLAARSGLPARTLRLVAVLAIIVLIGAIGAALVGVSLPGPLGALIARYRWTPLWSAGVQHDWLFYLRYFSGKLPVLWHLLPAAVALAALRAPRAALLCTLMLAAILVVHSFGAMKSPHYVAYALPFLMALYGFALSAVLPHLARLFETILGQVGVRSRIAAGLLLVVALGFAVAGNPMYTGTAAATAKGLVAVARGADPPDAIWTAVVQTPASWEPARDAVRRSTAGHAIIVTTDELRTLYHFGGYDLLLRRTRLGEYAPNREFARDPRTGGPTIGSPTSLAAVIDCWPSGILITSNADLAADHVVSDATVALIKRRMRPIAVPAGTAVRLFEWHRPAPEPAPAGRACAVVRQAVSGHGAAGTKP